MTGLAKHACFTHEENPGEHLPGYEHFNRALADHGAQVADI